MKIDKLITLKNPKSVVSESFRTLRTNIQYSNIDNEIKTIIVTSASSDEGKSSVVSNLAVSVAYTGKKVLVIDCDLRKPTIHKLMEISNLKGLTNVLIGEMELEEIVHKSGELETLYILTSGPIPPNPSELLGSRTMENFLNSLKSEYDMIIIDSPPVGLVTDAAVLSTKADGVLLVVAAAEVEIEEIKRAQELLEKVNANILGVVLNKVDIKSKYYYKYGYYQYYGETEEQSQSIKAK